MRKYLKYIITLFKYGHGSGKGTDAVYTPLDKNHFVISTPGRKFKKKPVHTIVTTFPDEALFDK